MNTLSQHTVWILVGIALLLGGYWYMSSRSSIEPSLMSGVTLNEAQIRFQTLVGELRSVSFDTDIFSDPRFTSLVDLATPVAPEPVGRIDPFAPVAGTGR